MTKEWMEMNLKQRKLLEQAMVSMDERWAEEAGMLAIQRRGQTMHSTRDTAFYALGLLLRGNEGDDARAERAICAVLDTQLDYPGEVFHGVFRSIKEQPTPVCGKLDWQNISREAHYFTDVFYENVANAFRKRLVQSPELKTQAGEIERQLGQAVLDAYPVVWATYDPNWREFILSTLAVVLLHFEQALSAKTVARMDHAARIGMAGAIGRSSTEFTPLNTNIRVMHVFMIDYFALRFHDVAAQGYALQYAERMLAEYRVHHTVAEFNSPTYNGVVLTYLGLWQKHGSSLRLRQLGWELEAGLWEDFAEQYNPAMKNLCGPYSRSYELEMNAHTALGAILYLASDDLPPEALPPLSCEAESYPVLCLSQVTLPAHVRPLLTASRGERLVRREFNELAERGMPGQDHALCIATSWITDEMMLGGMAGSKNSSHQLHAATGFWRNTEGSLSTLKLLRRSAEGDLKHFHTVYLDFTAGRNTLNGSVRMEAGRELVVYFEIESPALDQAEISAQSWHICGLNVQLDVRLLSGETVACPAPFFVERNGSILRVCYPAPDGSQLDFHLTLKLD